MSDSRAGESFDRFARDYEELLADPLRAQFASDGDFFIHQKCRALVDEIRRRFPDGRPSRPTLLDAGCGLGTAMAFFRDGFTIVGTDVSLPMLERSRQNGRIAVQEPFNLPLRDDSIDVAFAFCVYHHIDEAERVRHLRELARVVKPDGLICVFEHNPSNPVTRLVFARAPVDRGCKMIPRADLRALFRAAGLRDLRHRYILFVPESLIRVFGAFERWLWWLPLGGQYFVSGRKTARVR